MGAKFLCCLPLRLGVMVISFTQFLLSVSLAGIVWWALWYDSKHALHQFTGSLKVTAVCLAVVYSATALIAFLGLLGAIFKKIDLVKTFELLLRIALVFQIGTAIGYLATLFRLSNRSLQNCLQGTNDEDRITLCHDFDQHKHLTQVIMVVLILIPIFIQGYAVYVVAHYSRRLENKKAEKAHKLDPFLPNGDESSYQPLHDRHDESIPLAQPYNPIYPYADVPNSFGHTNMPKPLDVSHKV